MANKCMNSKGGRLPARLPRRGLRQARAAAGPGGAGRERRVDQDARGHAAEVAGRQRIRVGAANCLYSV